MKQFIIKHRWLLVGLVILIIIVSSITYTRFSSTSILDESAYKSLYKEFRAVDDAGGFASQEELRQYITSWADTNGVEYKIDKYGNIIFNTPAVSRKKMDSPTLVCCGYNYETVFSNLRTIVSVLMVASTETQSGRKTVMLCNDERNEAAGFRNISKKILTDKTKVIYLDYGNSSYISCSSFAECFSTITVPAKKSKTVGDTAVKVHISGVTSGEVTNNLSKHPDVISCFSSLMSRLKSKSTVFQIADVEIGSNGNMYPVSMDAVFVLNSYNTSSFASYIQKTIKNWEKSYGGSYEDIEFTYEVIDDPEDIPEKAYTRKSTDKLASVLYTLKSGIYKYEEDDDIPDDHEAGETCGLNYILGLRISDAGFCIDIMTQGYDDYYINKINEDNVTVADLYKCEYEVTRNVPRFVNQKDSLVRTLRNTHSKISRDNTLSSLLEIKSDNYVTPCSYLMLINDKSDIVHLRLNKDNAMALTNTILCYIKTKGNILSL